MNMMLRADVFMAQSDDMLVFLDLARDRYCALDRAWSARAARVLESGCSDQTLAVRLAEAGLLARDCVGRAFALTDHARPVCDLAPGTEFHLLDALRAWICRADAARSLARRPIDEIVRRRREQRARWKNSAASAGLQTGPALQATAGRFKALQPLAAREGACLENALALLTFLGRRGAEADWVFAVRAVPFTAHCWVQHGGVVLNDSLGNTQGYAPIMVA